jgi:5S rRNA maturation endonuclease (ribonuclease M5)
MLDPASWEDARALIPERGDEARTGHDCGPGQVLKVANGDRGYTAWCFRCGDKGFVPHPQPSLSERLALLARTRNAEVRASSSVSLPEPAVYDPQSWPDPARVWLYKAGLSNSDIVRLRFYWCPDLERVVMPVYDGDTLVYWQARALDGRQPKYLNPKVDRSRLVAKFGDGPTLVLTEDILSAVKVARVTSTWACMGTNLSDPVLLQIAATNKPVAIMLDPDAGGVKGRQRMRKQLLSVGVDAQIVEVRKDPKLLPTREICDVLLRHELPVLHRRSIPYHVLPPGVG